MGGPIELRISGDHFWCSDRYSDIFDILGHIRAKKPRIDGSKYCLLPKDEKNLLSQ